MLKKFALKNYKNFKEEISIDFGNIAGYQFSSDCISNGVIAKMLIYGSNATGKTNFGKAIMDISTTMFGASGFRENGAFFSNAREISLIYLGEFDDKQVVASRLYVHFIKKRHADYIV